MPTGPKSVLKHQRLLVTADGMGGNSITWDDVQNITGVLAPQSGGKQILRNGEIVQVNHRFFFNLPANMVPTEKDRFITIDGSRAFEILFINRPLNVKNILIAEMKETEKPLVSDPRSL